MIYIQRLYIHLCTSAPAAIEPARQEIASQAKAPVRPGADGVWDAPLNRVPAVRAGATPVMPRV